MSSFNTYKNNKLFTLDVKKINAYYEAKEAKEEKEEKEKEGGNAQLRYALEEEERRINREFIEYMKKISCIASEKETNKYS